MQYGALRRKIGGTYRDFFKDSVEGTGAYVYWKEFDGV